MAAFVLHVGAVAMCAHGGQAQPLQVEPRVRVGGQPVTTQASTYVVAGCALAASSGPFCVTAQFVSAALRVRARGVPVLLRDSASICAATGAPLSVVSTQTRVRAG